MNTHLDLMLSQSAELGEGLQWHGGSQRWWWTDIEGSSLQAWSPTTGLLVARLPDRLGCFAHTRSGQLLLGLAKRLCLAQLADPGASGSQAIALQQLVPIDASAPVSAM